MFPSDDGTAQRNGGLSAPVFSGASVTFFLYCSRCGAPVGELYGAKMPVAARVFLKTWFRTQGKTAAQSPDMPLLRCPDCYDAVQRGEPPHPVRTDDGR